MAAANEPVALFLVDAGASDFMARAHELHPLAKRVLLVDRDYSSTSPAVQAMILGHADYHITRPWPDAEVMYRVMSEYLSSWMREQEPSFEEFRVVAEEGDTGLTRLRDVMTQFSLPFGVYSSESEKGRRLLDQAGLDSTHLPVVIRYDGHVTVEPDLSDLARAIGVNIKYDVETGDVAIVGAGAAGLTAAVYAASDGLETVLLERSISGGQAAASPLIRNYPGFPHGVDGGLLMGRTCEQAWLMGAHIVFAQEAVALERRGDDRIVRLLDGTELRARAVVIATGIEWRRLGVPSLEALVGSGVFYGAASTEARAMQGQDVFIVGAGNSAGQAALHLAKHARTVTLLVRGDSLAKSMSSYLVRAIEATPNVVVRLRTEVVDGGGDGSLERITLADRVNGTTEEVSANALFVVIGGDPKTRWLPDEIDARRAGLRHHGSRPRDEHARRVRRGRCPAGFDQARRLGGGGGRDGRAHGARVPARGRFRAGCLEAMNELVQAGPDGRMRCWWCLGTPEYLAYHDEVWGRPMHGERELFEMLTLEAFQSGLSWLTILRKRDAFNRAFDGWDVERIAAYGDREVDRLLGDTGIVRHRGKIEATVANARAVLGLHRESETLDGLLWSFAPDRDSRSTPA